jgi:glutathione synthase/RimK-type ligase-like ATP-grasp enzyme
MENNIRRLNLMKKNITCLIDYKGNFSTKWNANPYRSGMDKELLKKYFSETGFNINFKKFHEVDFLSNDIKNNLYIYSSSEDIGYHYKDIIEDVILGIQENGGEVIPEFKFLRAHNNKVFMEILKKSYFKSETILNSAHYGSIEEVDFDRISYPVVFKSAAGAMSQGVALAHNRTELERIIKSRCSTRVVKKDIKDFFRAIKHKGYLKESLYRRKFILQEFIPNLNFDFKVIIFGERFYIFQRPVRKNDFRASGSGSKNYIYGSDVKFPEGIFDFASSIFEKLTVPHLSLDIAYDGYNFYLLEFQVLHFGTVGHVKSDGYYYKNNGLWSFQKEKHDLEKVYADSIGYYLQSVKYNQPVKV